MNIKKIIFFISIFLNSVLFANNITNKINVIEKEIYTVISWHERRQWSQRIFLLKECGDLEQLNKILIDLINDKNKNEDIIIHAKIILNAIKNKAILDKTIDEMNLLKENCIKAKQNILELESKIAEVQDAINYINYEN